ncbi:hypothetical protein GJ496_001892 [Pomphorhynchus laevis]|nr:hypothetical protein GJ496_001892 [Pomphorhynchus laevis]
MPFSGTEFLPTMHFNTTHENDRDDNWQCINSRSSLDVKKDNFDQQATSPYLFINTNGVANDQNFCRSDSSQIYNDYATYSTQHQHIIRPPPPPKLMYSHVVTPTPVSTSDSMDHLQIRNGQFGNNTNATVTTTPLHMLPVLVTDNLKNRPSDADPISQYNGIFSPVQSSSYNLDVPSVKHPDFDNNVNSFGEQSIRMNCPHCGNLQETHIVRKVGFTNIVASILACICLPCTWLGCQCIPMFVDDWKDAVHYCRACGRKLGSYNSIANGK